MKKEHIETLLEIVELYASAAKIKFDCAIEDGDTDIDFEEKELKQWTQIQRELEVMKEEETSDFEKLRAENILLRSILREMKEEVENIYEKRWLGR